MLLYFDIQRFPHGHKSNHSLTGSNNFICAPTGTAPFGIMTNFDDVFVDIETGLTVDTSIGVNAP